MSGPDNEVDEADIAAIMKTRKIGRARAEEIYAKRKARHADFEWYKVASDDGDESPEAR